MSLLFANGDTFAPSATPFSYAPVTTAETTPKIIVEVRLNDLPTQAFVDTGGVFIFISPEMADVIGLDSQGGLDTPNLKWRGGNLKGKLHQISVTLPAETGYPVTIEGTAFVPNLSPAETLIEDFPCILGMQGCLERLRFAVDPENEMFYFGELGTY